ncbi:MAG TPA: hypothetical protein VMT42_03920 [candidate division Zixibacteria bacterium]|nr:hypothetical protein [candidate division Zixibacteria bacterium]
MISISAIVFPTGITLLGLLAIIIGLVLLWVIVSIPVYLAGKIVTGGRSTLGEAMAASVLGPIVYFIVLTGVRFFLVGILGGAASTLGYILAFIAWIWIYKHAFKTGWLGGLAIAILAVVVFVIFGMVVGALLGIIAPSVSSGTTLMSLSRYVSLSLNI